MIQLSINRTRLLVDRSLVVISIVIGLVFIGQLLHWSNYGIDFSDEGFYLNWISNPGLYKASVMQFGFIYHPLYRLLGQDVVLLRQVNIVLTVCIAWALCFVLLRKFASNKESESAADLYLLQGIAFVFSTSSLMFLDLWLPTPNYNSLAFQSLMIVTIGIILAEPGSSRLSLIGWLLLGIGGWLALMAKPTTAAAAGLISLVYLIFSKKLTLRLLLISVIVAMALTAASALIIDGSIQVFVTRFMDGAENLNLLGGGHTLSNILRIDNFTLNRREKLFFIAITLLVFLSSHAATVRRESKSTGFLLFALVLCAASSLVYVNYLHTLLPRSPFLGMLMWAPAVGALLGIFLAKITSPGRLSLKCLSVDNLALISFFAVLPHVYAFGTNGNYWSAASSAAIFWVLCGAVIILMGGRALINWRALLAVALGAQIAVIMLIYTGLESPYRQPQPLRLNKDTIKIAHTNSELIVSNEFASYIQTLQVLADRGGFHKGDPIIDLTGHYPGLLYILGAKPIGDAWIIGGYKGSVSFAISVLNRASCQDLRTAWVLAEFEGPRKLNPAILKQYGLDIRTDFTVVAEVNSPLGSYPTTYKQTLLKPRRSLQEAQTQCEQAVQANS